MSYFYSAIKALHAGVSSHINLSIISQGEFHRLRSNQILFMVDIMVLLYLLDQNHTYIPMDGQTRQPEVETPTPEIMPQPIKEYD